VEVEFFDGCGFCIIAKEAQLGFGEGRNTSENEEKPSKHGFIASAGNTTNKDLHYQQRPVVSLSM